MVSRENPTSTAPAARAERPRQNNCALERGLRLLDVVVERGGLPVRDLAEAVGLPVSSTYRYVRQLRDAGYLYEAAGCYSLGPKFESAPEIQRAGHLVELAVPWLRRASDLTGETALVTVRILTAAVCLERVVPPAGSAPSFHRGTVRALDAGASATVLLAYAPDEVVRSVVAASGYSRGETEEAVRAVRRRLAGIRRRRFVVSYGEVDEGMCAVAAAAFRYGECICGVSVVGPRDRLADERLDRATQVVCAAAAGLSTQLSSARGVSAWIAS